MGGRKGLVGDGSELTRGQVKRVKDVIEMLDLAIQRTESQAVCFRQLKRVSSYLGPIVHGAQVLCISPCPNKDFCDLCTPCFLRS